MGILSLPVLFIVSAYYPISPTWYFLEERDPVVETVVRVMFLTILPYLIGHFVYTAWVQSYPIPEQETIETIPELVPPLTYNVKYGLVGHVVLDGRMREVAINPMLWPSFRMSNFVNPSTGLTKESFIPESWSEPLETGTEHNSQVFITSVDKMIGSGARVSHNGTTYLLTAAHVWFGMCEEIYITKRGMRIRADKKWKAMGSKHLSLDYVLVEVPAKVWSTLEVKAASMRPVPSQVSISVVGGDKSTELQRSRGMAVPADKPYIIHHTASTAPKWSGAPLYNGNTIVGCHLGANETDKNNRAVNVALLLNLKSETYYEGVKFGLLDMDNLDALDDLEQIDFLDGSVMTLGRTGYSTKSIIQMQEELEAKFKRRPWSSYAEDDDDTFYDTVMKLETDPSNLNCRRAEEPKLSPPSNSSQATLGDLENLETVLECLFTNVERRFARLENLVAKITETSQNLSSEFRSYQTSVGPIEDLTRKEPPSTSKLKDLTLSQAPQISKEPSGQPSEGILKRALATASQQKNGTSRKSGKKSKRYSKRKSIPTPPPGSPSPS